jgi:ribosomal protein L11 methyltransferase
VDYYELSIKTPDESRDAIITRLADMGATGFFENGDALVAYFSGQRRMDEICDELEQFRPILKAAGLDPGFSFQASSLPDRDWNETWKKNFSPIDVGENFTIIPSWLKSDTTRIPLVIDPGMVFGTGHHESTRTSLVLIEKLSPQAGKNRFLDIGTGSGILAIAASRLGFREVIGIDIDPLSVDAAQRNAEANGMTNIEIREGTIQDVSGAFDMIAANLLSEILIDIAGEIASHLGPEGTAILSGILSGQEKGVIKAVCDEGLLLKEEVLDGKWVSLVFNRPS